MSCHTIRLPRSRWARTSDTAPTLPGRLTPIALWAISRKAIERKIGARGLRSIMEIILLDTMFELPSLEGVEEVVISKQVVEGTAPPLYIYADRTDRTGDASA